MYSGFYCYHSVNIGAVIKYFIHLSPATFIEILIKFGGEWWVCRLASKHVSYRLQFAMRNHFNLVGIN